MNIPTQIELWVLDRLLPFARNSRTHSEEQVAQIAASIQEFGWTAPILVDGEGTIIAGHARLAAARKLGMKEVPVIVLGHLTPVQRRALVITDNRLSELGGWDAEMLRTELAALRLDDFDLAVVGFSDEELSALLASDQLQAEDPDAGAEQEEVPPAPANPVTRPGDIWLIGKHRLICGDCRDSSTLARLFAESKANVVITSPPYATQREYDASSGFKPIPPDEYVEWYKAVAANLRKVLVGDGSYFLNIKEHADEGERHLYVKDLVIAHRRQWGWRFVDEFCWRKTDNGVPGGWGNRFKNAWEPVFHFCGQQQIKFRPTAVGHESDDCIVYSPDNPKSRSGSGLLGCGEGREATRETGVARPSNVIEVKSESSQGSHSAPFPRALVEFFVLAFSDPGDLVFDPFMGSGTTMAAAEKLGRIGYGSELSPAYCDVILRRMTELTGTAPLLAASADGEALDGKTFTAVAEARGVDPNQALNPKAQDSGAIKHRGAAPCYGSRKKAK